MDVRLATAADLPELMRLAHDFHFAMKAKKYALWEDSEVGWRAWIEACIAGGDKICIYSPGVAFCTAVCGSAFWNPAVVAVYETVLWVDPKERGKGIATEIIAAMDAWARAKGATMLAVGRSYDMGQGGKPKDMDRLLQKLKFAPHEKIYSRMVT